MKLTGSMLIFFCIMGLFSDLIIWWKQFKPKQPMKMTSSDLILCVGLDSTIQLGV